MNIADNLSLIAERFPAKTAVCMPVRKSGKYDYQNINFETLEYKTNQYANGLLETGLARGQKVLPPEAFSSIPRTPAEGRPCPRYAS